MKTYKATVKDKQTKQMVTVTSDYPNKTAFVKDLRANGYAVNAKRVATAERYDWILANTDADDRDFEQYA